MRHKRVGRKLGVVSKHRRAMFRNMATDLFRHESITTTDARAKEIRRVAEKMITLAKKGTLQARRQAAAFIKDKDVLKKLFSEIAEKCKDRPGGYTRIIKMGYRRGDNAALSMIEIVQEEYKVKKKKKKPAKKSTESKSTESSSKKSTKKESAEELGLIEDAAKGAVATEAVAEGVDEVTPETEAEAKTDSPEVKEEIKADEIQDKTEAKTEPETQETEEIKAEAEAKPDEEPEAKSESKEESVTEQPEAKADESSNSDEVAPADEKKEEKSKE